MNWVVENKYVLAHVSRNKLDSCGLLKLCKPMKRADIKSISKLVPDKAIHYVNFIAEINNGSIDRTKDMYTIV